MGSKIIKQGIVSASGNGVNKNYLKNSNFLQGTNGFEGYYTNGSVTCIKQVDCMKVVGGSTTSGFYTGNYDSITTGNMATFSAYVRADSSMTIYIGVDGSGTSNCQSYTIGTNWQLIKISKAKTTDNANLRIYGQGTFYTKFLKYELGSVVTPWCVNPADSVYVGSGIGLYETNTFPAKIANDWIQASSFIEI